MKYYAVKGGTVFIESHITEELLRVGHQVNIIDNLRTSFMKSLEGLNIKFFKADIQDKALVESLLLETDGVFHLAGLISFSESLLNVNDFIGIQYSRNHKYFRIR